MKKALYILVVWTIVFATSVAAQYFLTDLFGQQMEITAVIISIILGMIGGFFTSRILRKKV